MGKKLSLFGAYAHPDDEQGVTGLLHQYAKNGVDVALAYGTRGEVGEIAPGVNATPETLGQVREEEMRCAAEKIGIHNLYFLDYRDSGMIGTKENSDSRALWNADLFEVTEKLVKIIRRHKPHVILTFDAYGGYGHPDHIKIHQATLMAYFVAGDPRSYPAHLKEGLEPWTPLKLYWTAFPRSRWQKYAELAEARGIDISTPMKEFLKRSMPDEIITTRIDVSDYVDLKLHALDCHASQLNPDGIWRKIPPEIRKEGLKVETLVRGESRLLPPQGIEQDLFEGVE